MTDKELIAEARMMQPSWGGQPEEMWSLIGKLAARLEAALEQERLDLEAMEDASYRLWPRMRATVEQDHDHQVARQIIEARLAAREKKAGEE